MNFLGHLYFSNNDLKLMYANLYGDFVKGKDLSAYPKYLQKGIRLHREIDHYIDNHPKVKELVLVLYPDLPKVAPIAVDLFFDHILAKRWNEFNEETLDSFLKRFYSFKDFSPDDYTDQFLFMIMRMRNSNWLLHYKTLEGLDAACKGVSQRISFPNQLKYAVYVFKEYQEQIETAFEIYMEDAIRYFTQYHKSKS